MDNKRPRSISLSSIYELKLPNQYDKIEDDFRPNFFKEQQNRAKSVRIKNAQNKSRTPNNSNFRRSWSPDLYNNSYSISNRMPSVRFSGDFCQSYRRHLEKNFSHSSDEMIDFVARKRNIIVNDDSTIENHQKSVKIKPIDNFRKSVMRVQHKRIGDAPQKRLTLLVTNVGYTIVSFDFET